MTTLTIRTARRQDVPAIVRMLADDPLGARRERFADPLPDCYWRAFDVIEGDPHNEIVVAEQDGRVVGCLQITFIPGLTRQGMTRAQIEGVRVDGSMRGAGVGRQLVLEALDRARERGCGMVQLTTDKSRAEAHRFYEALGFVATHEGMKLEL
ncbi:MAG TPA: GNAT family N-acetyltransferase [Alphaproteobacteria bacterium]|nr:GNAT family N-acetyltransferase [Alphaproteobacteria bacterium]